MKDSQPVAGTRHLVATLGVQLCATLPVRPPGTTPSTPTLISPASDARFAPGQSITFDWTVFVRRTGRGP